eukprot:Nk52_evm54s208 gene=Nk52_evmTU54s208
MGSCVSRGSQATNQTVPFPCAASWGSCAAAHYQLRVDVRSLINLPLRVSMAVYKRIHIAWTESVSVEVLPIDGDRAIPVDVRVWMNQHKECTGVRLGCCFEMMVPGLYRIICTHRVSGEESTILLDVCTPNGIAMLDPEVNLTRRHLDLFLEDSCQLAIRRRCSDGEMQSKQWPMKVAVSYAMEDEAGERYFQEEILDEWATGESSGWETVMIPAQSMELCGLCTLYMTFKEFNMICTVHMVVVNHLKDISNDASLDSCYLRLTIGDYLIDSTVLMRTLAYVCDECKEGGPRQIEPVYERREQCAYRVDKPGVYVRESKDGKSVVIHSMDPINVFLSDELNLDPYSKNKIISVQNFGYAYSSLNGNHDSSGDKMLVSRFDHTCRSSYQYELAAADINHKSIQIDDILFRQTLRDGNERLVELLLARPKQESTVMLIDKLVDRLQAKPIYVQKSSLVWWVVRRGEGMVSSFPVIQVFNGLVQTSGKEYRLLTPLIATNTYFVYKMKVEMLEKKEGTYPFLHCFCCGGGLKTSIWLPLIVVQEMQKGMRSVQTTSNTSIDEDVSDNSSSLILWDNTKLDCQKLDKCLENLGKGEYEDINPFIRLWHPENEVHRALPYIFKTLDHFRVKVVNLTQSPLNCSYTTDGSLLVTWGLQEFVPLGPILTSICVFINKMEYALLHVEDCKIQLPEKYVQKLAPTCTITLGAVCDVVKMVLVVSPVKSVSVKKTCTPSKDSEYLSSAAKSKKAVVPRILPPVINVKNITQDSAMLYWSKPVCKGGASVSGYSIIVWEDLQKTGTGDIVRYNKTHYVNSPLCSSFRLTGLLLSTAYSCLLEVHSNASSVAKVNSKSVSFSCTAEEKPIKLTIRSFFGTNLINVEWTNTREVNCENALLVVNGDELNRIDLEKQTYELNLPGPGTYRFVVGRDEPGRGFKVYSNEPVYTVRGVVLYEPKFTFTGGPENNGPLTCKIEWLQPAVFGDVHDMYLFALCGFVGEKFQELGPFPLHRTRCEVILEERKMNPVQFRLEVRRKECTFEETYWSHSIYSTNTLYDVSMCSQEFLDVQLIPLGFNNRFLIYCKVDPFLRNSFWVVKEKEKVVDSVRPKGTYVHFIREFDPQTEQTPSIMATLKNLELKRALRIPIPREASIKVSSKYITSKSAMIEWMANENPYGGTLRVWRRSHESPFAILCEKLVKSISINSKGCANVTDLNPDCLYAYELSFEKSGTGSGGLFSSGTFQTTACPQAPTFRAAIENGLLVLSWKETCDYHPEGGYYRIHFGDNTFTIDSDINTLKLPPLRQGTDYLARIQYCSGSFEESSEISTPHKINTPARPLILITNVIIETPECVRIQWSLNVPSNGEIPYKLSGLLLSVSHKGVFVESFQKFKGTTREWACSLNKSETRFVVIIGSPTAFTDTGFWLSDPYFFTTYDASQAIRPFIKGYDEGSVTIQLPDVLDLQGCRAHYDILIDGSSSQTKPQETGKNDNFIRIGSTKKKESIEIQAYAPPNNLSKQKLRTALGSCKFQLSDIGTERKIFCQIEPRQSERFITWSFHAELDIPSDAEIYITQKAAHGQRHSISHFYVPADRYIWTIPLKEISAGYEMQYTLELLHERRCLAVSFPLTLTLPYSRLTKPSLNIIYHSRNTTILQICFEDSFFVHNSSEMYTPVLEGIFSFNGAVQVQRSLNSSGQIITFHHNEPFSGYVTAQLLSANFAGPLSEKLVIVDVSSGIDRSDLGLSLFELSCSQDTIYIEYHVLKELLLAINVEYSVKVLCTNYKGENVYRGTFPLHQKDSRGKEIIGKVNIPNLCNGTTYFITAEVTLQLKSIADISLELTTLRSEILVVETPSRPERPLLRFIDEGGDFVNLEWTRPREFSRAEVVSYTIAINGNNLNSSITPETRTFRLRKLSSSYQQVVIRANTASPVGCGKMSAPVSIPPQLTKLDLKECNEECLIRAVTGNFCFRLLTSNSTGGQIERYEVSIFNSKSKKLARRFEVPAWRCEHIDLDNLNMNQNYEVVVQAKGHQSSGVGGSKKLFLSPRQVGDSIRVKIYPLWEESSGFQSDFCNLLLQRDRILKLLSWTKFFYSKAKYSATFTATHERLCDWLSEIDNEIRVTIQSYNEALKHPTFGVKYIAQSKLSAVKQLYVNGYCFGDALDSNTGEILVTLDSILQSSKVSFQIKALSSNGEVEGASSSEEVLEMPRLLTHYCPLGGHCNPSSQTSTQCSFQNTLSNERLVSKGAFHMYTVKKFPKRKKMQPLNQNGPSTGVGEMFTFLTDYLRLDKLTASQVMVTCPTTGAVKPLGQIAATPGTGSENTKISAMVVIWDPLCKSCIYLMRMVEEYYSVFHGKIRSIGIALTSEPALLAISKCKENYFYDKSKNMLSQLIDELRINSVPTILYLDYQGIVINRSIGCIYANVDSFQKVLESIYPILGDQTIPSLGVKLANIIQQTPKPEKSQWSVKNINSKAPMPNCKYHYTP